MNRSEIIARLTSACLGLTLSFSVTYFVFKYLADVLDPTRKEKKEAQERADKLLKKIGVTDIKLSEYELCIASNLMDPQSLDTMWEDIGGLDDIISEIKETVILPYMRSDLFEGSALLTAPKGVLLYGPPGCGKTMIAKVIAKQAGARFINLQVSSLVDKWYGESQKRVEAVFSLAFKLQPSIIFIDEIDSFLRARNTTDHESTVMMKTQFMSFWDGIETDQKCKVMVVGATNRPNDVDWAILRRMPSMFQIGLPNLEQRQRILSIILRSEKTSPGLDLQTVAMKTEGFSGSDLKELCRKAAIYRIREFLRNESEAATSGEVWTDQLKDISMNDFSRALGEVKQSRLVSLISSQQIALD